MSYPSWDCECRCTECVAPGPAWPVSLCKHVPEPFKAWPLGHTCGAWQCSVCPVGYVPCFDERNDMERCANGEC